jgi:hypothetical protein
MHDILLKVAYSMFNGFLPRFIAEKGIDTGNDSIADTYRQCKLSLNWANEKMYGYR